MNTRQNYGKDKLVMLIVVALLILHGCISAPDYPDEPVIEFRQFSKESMKQGSINEDSVLLVLYFTDGDGNFGIDPNKPQEQNIFIKDNRTGEEFRTFRTPLVPDKGSSNGISGTISIKVFTTCCLFSPDSQLLPCESSTQFPTNSLTLDIYITDRAGNHSNTVTTPPLIIRCE